MHALGLTLTGDVDERDLVPGQATGDRRCELRALAREGLASHWPAGAGVRIAEQRGPEGEVLLTVDRDPERGYRVAAPGYGVRIVAADGRLIHGVLPDDGEPWRARLLLFARALPIAAVLQGVETLHASAVVLDGRAIGLVAASGTGKSSLATHLVARGAEFLTDDVLAIEPRDGRILAHPGARLTKVARHEHAAAGRAGQARLGARVGVEQGELVLTPGGGPTVPVPLAALYVLRRAGSAPVRIEPAAPDPRLLLAMSYVFDVETPQRLAAQLDLLAELARAVRVFSVTLPAAGSAAAAAAIVETHARELA